MNNIKLEAHIDGLGSIVYSEDIFNKSLRKLQKSNARLMSINEVALARIQIPPYHLLNLTGTYVSEGIVAIPRVGIIVTNESPILQFPEEATASHERGSEFFLDSFLNKKNIEKYIDLAKLNMDSFFLADWREIPEDSNTILSLPVEKLGDDEKTEKLFKGEAKKYGEFLKESGCEEFVIWFNSRQYIENLKRPHANQLWFRWLDIRSGIMGNNLLNNCSRVRGICNYKIDRPLN